MTESDRVAIIRELAQYAGFGRPPDGVVTFTAEDYGAEVGLHRDTARRQLKALQEQGIISSCVVPGNGHRQIVYWKVKR